MSTDYFAEAFDCIAYGSAIVTAKAGCRSSSLHTTWIQRAGEDPPMVSVAVKKGQPIVDVIDSAGLFGINIIGEQMEAAIENISKCRAQGENALAGLWTCDWGGAIRIGDCIAYLSATVYGKYDAGDHWIYVGEVTCYD